MSASAIRPSDVPAQIRSSAGGRGASPSDGSGFADIYNDAGARQKPASASSSAADATDSAPSSDGTGGSGSAGATSRGPASAGDPSPADASAALGSNGKTGGDDGAMSDRAASDLAKAAEKQPVSGPAAAKAGPPVAALPTSDAAAGGADDTSPDESGSDSSADNPKKKEADASGVIAAILAPPPPIADLAKALEAAQAGAAGSGGKAAAAGRANAPAGPEAAQPPSGQVANAQASVQVATAAASGGSQSALLSLNARLAAIKTAGEGGKGTTAPAAARDGQPAAKEVAEANRVSGVASGEGSPETAGDKGSSKPDIGALLAGMHGADAGGPAQSRNISTLAVRIASGAAAATATPATAAGPDAAQPAVVTSLKIELNPANLGSVTATLRVTGNRLAIDLKVASDAAYHELSTGNDALVDKLKGHGYVVEQVSVQQVGGAARQAQVQHNPGSGQQQASGQAGSGARQQSFGQGGGGQGAGSDGRSAPMVPQPAAAGGDGRRGADGLYL